MNGKTVISVDIEIIVEGKYCDERCEYYQESLGVAHCSLFLLVLKRCLGGGPLRCEKCVKAGGL